MKRAAQLGRLLGASGKSAPALPPELPMLVSLWRGAVKVSLGDVQSLRPGDVVLLDDIENEAATALMMIGGRFVAPVEFTSEGPCLMAGLRPVTGSKWEWIMDQTKNPDAAQALDDADLENLPVTLVFELGRTALPLGELKQLAPGAIVPLPEVAKEIVDVIANGKRVGRGEVVRIGESLGVRLVRMFDNA
jgi:type III secretion protein Q